MCARSMLSYVHLLSKGRKGEEERKGRVGGVGRGRNMSTL